MGKAEELLEAFREMTLLELSQFVRQFEETFGVTAAVPVTVLPPPAEAEQPPEQEEWDVILESAGERKIQVIKEVRAITKLGLKEAKDLVDSAPAVLLEKVAKDAAGRARDALVNSGATVTVR